MVYTSFKNETSLTNTHVVQASV